MAEDKKFIDQIKALQLEYNQLYKKVNSLINKNMENKTFITKEGLKKENWILRGIVTNPGKNEHNLHYFNKKFNLNIIYDFKSKDLKILKDLRDINNPDLILFKGRCEYISDFELIIKNFNNE